MFKHRPDGMIEIGALVYPLSEFVQDEPGYILPTPYIRREYIPGEGRHSLFTPADQRAGPCPWPEGDQYIAKEAQYQAAYAQRLASAAEAEQAAAANLPNWPGFIAAVRDGVFATNWDRVGQMMAKYPLFYAAAEKGVAAAVQSEVLRANTAGDLTQVEYDGIKSAAGTYHIPIVLP